MKKPLVYIASPYTHGDKTLNTYFQMRTFEKMMNDAVVWPYAPLWSHFQHLTFPRPEKDWYAFDNEILKRCDALVRLVAHLPDKDYKMSKSVGAAAEVNLAHELKIPVFWSIDGVYAWAKNR